VNNPGGIFDIALARVEEIVLGMTCATVVHSLVLPQSFGPVLLARLDNAVQDAHRWIRDALNPAGDTRSAGDRRKLATDITELRLMSTHLPFDTSHLRWTGRAVNALQERLSLFVPIVSGIEDRLEALRKLGALDVMAHWKTLLDDVVALADTPKDLSLAREAERLRDRVDELAPPLLRALGWTGMIEVNLAARLRRLIDVCVETRALRQHIDTGVHGRLPEAVRQLPRVPPSALHQDRGMALLSAFAAMVAILSCCAFWILTGWPAGSAAPMMAAVLCCFFSTQDNPVPFIKGFLEYTVYSIPMSALYLLVLLPAAHNFETLVLLCAPTFLVLGIYVARPSTFGRAFPFLFGVVGTLALMDTNTADIESFTNGMLSQIVGLAAAAVFTSVLRSVGAGWTARRLLKAGWSELARLGNGERVTMAAFSARMVDRIGLLAPRLALAAKQPNAQQDLQAVDALRDLRVGLNMTLLQGVRARLGHADVAVAPLMKQLARHFASLPKAEKAYEPGLLTNIDDALRAVSGHENGANDVRCEALAALTGMRRDLFPNAAPYEPSLVTDLV